MGHIPGGVCTREREAEAQSAHVSAADVDGMSYAPSHRAEEHPTSGILDANERDRDDGKLSGCACVGEVCD
jgi:hypothetical protein